MNEMGNPGEPLAHRLLGDYVELAGLLRLYAPDGAQVIRPDDLLVIRYAFGRLNPDQFNAVADHLETDFPELRFILIESDEVYLRSRGRVVRRSSRPDE